MKQLVWKKRENKRLIHRALSLIMALSMACTGVLPAMAEGESEKEAASYYCGKEEHIHQDCDSSVLVCQLEEGEEHTHADTCYEVVSCELEEHTHTENCLVELDEQSEEEETTEQENQEEITEQEEKEQESIAYYCGKEEHSCDESCEENCLLVHSHDESCTVKPEETPAETPTEVCAKEEHSHSETCYDAEGLLICVLEEHTHDESCNLPQEEAVEAAAEYYCGKEEHEHNEELCYDEGELICSKEEHSHDQSCLPDEEAINGLIERINELPTSEEFEAKLAELEENDDIEGRDAWLEDILALGQACYDRILELPPVLRDMLLNFEEVPAYLQPLADAYAKMEYLLPYLDTDGGVEEYIGYIESDEPDKDDYTSTRDFIELNLYDYDSNINNYWYSDEKYPGFQWNGGAYKFTGNDESKNGMYAVDNIDFGNSLITDYSEYEGTNSGENSKKVKVTYTNSADSNAKGAINYIIEKPDDDYTNYPIGVSTNSQALSLTLGEDGYPALLDGTSLGYLFKSGEGVTKKNTESIDGLFLQNDVTGAYSYNSRTTHAQYSNNFFTRYQDIITPNFILYPFGNFLPFNDITTSDNATQVGKINNIGAYIDKVQSKLGSTSTEKQLDDMLKFYEEKLGTENLSKSAQEIAEDFIINGVKNGPGSVDLSGEVENMYNIDWDVETDFFFGMEMKMNLLMPKDGYTGLDIGNNNEDFELKGGNYVRGGDSDGEPDYPMVFDFSGDDDVWVYVDGVLFLDLSGIHRHVGGRINFDSGIVQYFNLDPSTGDVSNTKDYLHLHFEDILDAAGVSVELQELKNADGTAVTCSHDGCEETLSTFKDYSTHSFNFYYLERGSGSSVCRMNFNFPLLPLNSIQVSKEVTEEEENTLGSLGNPDYRFRIMKADGTEPLITSDDIGENKISCNIVDASGLPFLSEDFRVDENGIFTLKAGQTAMFNHIPANAGKYYVEELIDEDFVEQYGNVEVNGSVIESSDDVKLNEKEFKGYKSPTYDTSNSVYFAFNNKLTKDKGSLSIKKLLTDEDADSTEFQDKEFFFKVTLDDERIPEGTSYTVTLLNEETKTKYVDANSCIKLKHGETATINNIIAGSEFTVTELNAAAEGYDVSYAVPESSGATISDGVVSGSIKTDAAVSVTATNHVQRASIDIPVYKTVVAPDSEEHWFKFNLTEVADTQGTTKQGAVTYNTAFKVNAGENSGTTVLDDGIATNDPFHFDYVKVGHGITPDFEKVYYYQIEEIGNADNFGVNYDPAKFIVEVTVGMQDNDFTARITDIYKDGVSIKKGEDIGTVSFTNTLMKPLEISKTVTHKADDKSTFTFTVTATGLGSLHHITDNTYNANVEYTGSLSGTTSVPFTIDSDGKGTATVTLKHGESIKIWLPGNCQWTVEEVLSDEQKKDYDTFVANSQVDTATGSLPTQNNVVFTNRYMTELTIGKNVTTDNELKPKFKFKITLSGDQGNEIFNEEFTAYRYSNDVKGESEKIKFEGNVSEITLEHNEMLELRLPGDVSWKVEELLTSTDGKPAEWRVVHTSDDKSYYEEDSANGVLPDNMKETFHNTEMKPLEIKKVTPHYDDKAMEKLGETADTFTFEVKVKELTVQQGVHTENGKQVYKAEAVYSNDPDKVETVIFEVDSKGIGTAIVQLQDGESVQIWIPSNAEWTVSEQTDGLLHDYDHFYEISNVVDGGVTGGKGLTVPEQDETVEGDEYLNLSDYNKVLYKNRYMTNLLIQKIVTDTYSDDENPQFCFRITLDDKNSDETINEIFQAWFTNQSDVRKEITVEFKENTALFYLRDRETLEIRLPGDLNWKVEELTNGWVTRYKINDNKTFSWYSDTAKGSLPIEEKVTFYNSPHIFRTDEIDVRVKKVWKNDDTSTRPNKVTVELYRDGKYYDTVTLSEKNNWTYRWEDLDEDYNWTVKEVNVADGYEVSYKQRGNTTTITNSGRMLDDDGMLWWPVPVLLGAGAVLIVAGKRTSRRKDDEE